MFIKFMNSTHPSAPVSNEDPATTGPLVNVNNISAILRDTEDDDDTKQVDTAIILVQKGRELNYLRVGNNYVELQSFLRDNGQLLEPVNAPVNDK
jgi:hypothetical protein